MLASREPKELPHENTHDAVPVMARLRRSLFTLVFSAPRRRLIMAEFAAR